MSEHAGQVNINFKTEVQYILIIFFTMDSNYNTIAFIVLCSKDSGFISQPDRKLHQTSLLNNKINQGIQ